ncbi:deoxycytidyl transferase [Toensbergia leucococca]|nr:deoxycytidyl transferase [Toensbergia leucococca]
MGSRLEANSSVVRKRIEKHKFENEEGDEYEPSKFGGFTDYFRRKKIKLQNLDTELRSQSTTNSSIFRGVVAHVNGYTQPSLNDLHVLVVSHGGGFMQYLDGKTKVTHIIASNLTPKKKIEFRKYRIVKPAWVVDSVQAGKLLPWDGYRVVDEGVGQQVLGFDNGNVTSQVNYHHEGYRDQTNTSWYTEQIKSVAEELDLRGSDYEDFDIPFSSAQISPTVNDGENDTSRLSCHQTGENPMSTVLHQSPSLDEIDTEGKSNSASKGDLRATVPGSEISFNFDESLSDPYSNNNQELTLDSSVQAKLTQDLHDGDPSSIAKNTKLSAEEHNAVLLADPRVWKSTVVNPGFLKQYYEESRLHHLSTWKADLKSQLQALASKKSSSQKSRQKRAPGSRRYILHVDFDSFFAAVSLRKYPQYVDKPAVVAHGGGSGSEIASCNYPARQFGVKNGMWMKTAQQLCANLKVLPYDFKAYEEASRSFYDVIMSTDGLVQSVSVDEALIDISSICVAASGHDGKGVHEGSIWRAEAKADEIAQGLRDQIKHKTGCAVSVGIGGNILLAKVALRKAKPAGQYHIKPDEVLDFVGDLTVQDLPGVAYSIGGKLEEIGVKYVKDVRELSKEKLMSTLGPKTGEKIWDYSRGIDRMEVGEHVTRKSVSAEVNWGIRFVNQDQADEFVQCLCDELHRRLDNEKAKGRQLTMKIMRRAADAPLDPPKHLGHGKCDTFNKSIVLGVATNEKEILGREAISIMRGWAFSPGELRGIGVQMTRLEPLKAVAESPMESSQKLLQFTTSNPNNTPTRHLKFKPSSANNTPIHQDDPIIDDLPSPHKPRLTSTEQGAVFQMPDDERHKPLNTMGTQFVMPTQVDPAVLAELPADIRSKLLPNQSTSPRFREEIPSVKARSSSPALTSTSLPSHSQLDQETLDALPSDVRAEVLAFYDKSPQKPSGQRLLPQSPRKVRAVNDSSKKIVTPTKRCTGLLSRGKKNIRSNVNSTLTQSNFVANRAPSRSETLGSVSLPPDTEEVSDDFLSALPDDIRREILAQQRRDRLKKLGGIDLTAKKKLARPTPVHPPPGQRYLHLPPKPPKPTFTAKKLTAISDLREAVSAWFEEFQEEGPYEEDIEALVVYLQKVVGEERDMAKAVRVVHWLSWVMEHKSETRNAAESWKAALGRVEAGVQMAVKGRGLGAVVF